MKGFFLLITLIIICGCASTAPDYDLSEHSVFIYVGKGDANDAFADALTIFDIQRSKHKSAINDKVDFDPRIDSPIRTASELSFYIYPSDGYEYPNREAFMVSFRTRKQEDSVVATHMTFWYRGTTSSGPLAKIYWIPVTSVSRAQQYALIEEFLIRHTPSGFELRSQPSSQKFSAVLGG